MKMKRVVLIALAAVLTIALAACAADVDDTPEIQPDYVEFSLYVVLEDGESEAFSFMTAQEYLGDALLESGLVEGEQTPMGLMISHINGVRADFVLDGAWWRFYIDGEPALAGVSETRIDPDAVYEFRHTPA